VKYRKKPVVVEAEQFDPLARPWPDCVHPWADEEARPRDMSWGYIETLEGKMHVMAGDFIITGVKGEQYPCKPDIFALTYESAEAQQDQDAIDAAVARIRLEMRCPCRRTATLTGTQLVKVLSQYLNPHGIAVGIHENHLLKLILPQKENSNGKEKG
jgi:hypothetical protein